MKIVVTGLNHKSAPIDIREKLAFDSAKAMTALKKLKNRFPASEFVLLSTCNRVELYCAGESSEGADADNLAEFFSEFHDVPLADFQDFLYVHDGTDTVRHLLTVASSLDSMVVGESQIIAQVKESYRLACTAKSAGKVLNRLFHTAFTISKKIYTNTSIASGRISVAGVAVELAMQIFAKISSAKVVVIGAGEMGELLVQHLLHVGCKNITVVNRSYDRGLKMADNYGITALKWDKLLEQIPLADIVIASAGAQDYLFKKDAFEKITAGRRKGALLVIDIAVPRNFEPSINNIDDVYLYSVDELSEVAEQNRKVREEDVAKGAEIICKGVAAFMDWFGARDIGPLIGKMRQRFAQIGQKELERFFVGSRQEASCKEMAESMVNRIVNKLLHCVIKNVNTIAREHNPSEAAKLVDSIVKHAEEISSESDGQDAKAVTEQNLKSRQILRLLFWESTIKCNLTCAHCRRLESDEAAVTDLSTAQAKNLIDQLARLGKSQPMMPVLVFSGGEPLCRQDLFELVDYAGSLGITPALATNGTLIDQEVAKRIHDSKIARVAVSLDGATAEVHNKLRQLDGSFERAIEGIGYLHEENIPFQINITLTKNNAAQLEQIYELAKSLGAVAVHIFMLVPVGCGQTLAETDMLSPHQYEQMLLEACQLDGRGQLQVKVTCAPHYQRVIREQGLYQTRRETEGGGANVPGRGKHGGSSKGCLAGLGVLFVGHAGDVFPCGYLPVKCGNVLKEKLADIWYQSSKLAVMRDSRKLEGKCGICEYKHVCGGCRARAFAQTGNYMAEEPFCEYVPHAGCKQLNTKN